MDLTALFESEVYAEQKKLGGRVPIPDAKIKRLLSALASRGGTMTAAAWAVQLGSLSIDCLVFYQWFSDC